MTRTRRRWRVLLGGVLALVTLAACTQTIDGTASPANLAGASAGASGGTTTAKDPVDPLAPVPDPGKPGISWVDCTSTIQPQLAGEDGADRDLKYSCGQMKVPVDYAKPDNGTLTLVLVKVHLNTQQSSKGSLVVNPGGPGGSGANLAIGLGLSLPMEILDNFDIVGFDPRGVGESEPVECLSADEKDKLNATTADPQSATEIDDYVAGVKSLAQACKTSYPNLEHINTVETARDMDQIRKAVGDEKLTYLGYSYGTELGGVYATLFPDKIRAFVLDGAVNPSLSPVASTKAQLEGFENAFKRFADNCVAKAGGCTSGPDPAATVAKLLVDAKASPIPTTASGDSRTATDGIVTTAVASALYDEGSWPKLDAALAKATAGDAAGLFELADSYNDRYDNKGKVTYSNILEANVAVNCNDNTELTTLDQTKKYAEDWRKEYPLFGGNFAWGTYTCTEWPTRRHPEPKVDASGSAPILVVGTKNDPATPYSGAVELTKKLGTATLLSWEGDGHTAYPKTDCITKAVNDYLINLTVPAEGTDCPAA